MKKLLQNPIVVLILVLLAGFYLYWNVMRPMLGLDSKAKVKVAKAKNPHQDENFDNDENNESEENSKNLKVLTYDSNVINHWKPSWVFDFSRDPFRIENRKRHAQTVDLRPEQAVKPTKRYRSRNYRKSNFVQAISIGTQDTLALIGGKTVKIKDLSPQLKDTVEFILNHQKQKFIFKPKATP
tara:strand:- start:1966 stop:2514 length:549 start_codon:yes stop_codon:yes gene_type:complete